MTSSAIILLLIARVFMVQSVNGNVEPWKKSEESAEQGSEVQLPCILKSPRCGGLHSIKWYRGTQRIFIFSESAGITRGNNDIAVRSSMDYNTNATKTFLKISNLKLEDEGLYKCEATYLAVNRECNNVQHITLNTTVRPKHLAITEDGSKMNLTAGTIIGPINEGTKVTLTCESDAGKPVPTVEWYKDNERLKAIWSTKILESGVGTASSVLQLQIGRTELGATFTCKASSPALANPLTIAIGIDVHVRPLKMDVKGVVGHVVSGTKILLECEVSAARPPANVTWYNGTDLLTDDNERFEMFETKVDDNSDGTSETSSYFAFTASQYDNGQTFSCFAENSVMKTEGIKPMKESTTIEVLYAPIVTLHPSNITVNESENFVMICNYEANPATLTAVKWLRNGVELSLSTDHYEGGVTEQTSLTVKKSSATDMGTYTCILSNSVGESTPEEFVDVSVLYKPTVVVIIEPEVPVNEADRLNVSLTCDIVSGNPMGLSAVRWYLDGDLLKELPDCTRNSTTADIDDTSTFCDIDPSKLLLEAVGRSFHGNYSCEGRNDAGWGPISPTTPVIVHYKPGVATITHQPRRVIKGGSLNITCSVIDPGRPPLTGYKWIRGVHRLADQEKSFLTIDSVNLRTKANFTCIAYNEAGDGDPATTFIDVTAPPAFIHPLPPYYGYVYNAVNVSIGCRVECSPICNVSWIKNNAPINFTAMDRYYVTTILYPADQSTSDFESIQSNLTWNLDEWPNGELDRYRDNDNYTCKSTDNGIGDGVKSTTHFQVEFPPENMTISKKTVDVVVDFIPESVKCSAIAHPEPTFRWYREGSMDTISQSPVLIFETKVPKRSNGTYICEASNRHGSQNVSTYLNVLYKPECQINKEQINGDDYLVCSSFGNPEQSNFTWSLKSENDSLSQLAEIRNEKSYLLLDTAITNFRTYICIANNTIGSSLPCERSIPGNLPWWLHLEGDLLIIVIIVAVIILLVIIVCCFIIYLMCRRKQIQVKYSNRVVAMEEREHPDGGPPSPTESIHSHERCSSLNSKPAPRWPLKPGVLVHINRTHSLSSGLSSVHANSNLQIHSTTSTYQSDRYRCREGSNVEYGETNTVFRRPVRPFKRGKMTFSQMGVNIPIVHDEGMIARANRIRAMFSSQLKQPDSFPGISREKTAVTYKRIVPRQRMSCDAPSALQQNYNAINGIGCSSSINNNTNVNASRKRKKPGADPGHPSKNNNSHIDSMSEALPELETKSFYENLPFHGIQTPPNKFVASPKFAHVSALHGELHSTTSSPCSSRSVSRVISICGGSSGYESTKSHLGPHYSSHNMPRNNSPELKYNTLKPRRRKQNKHAPFYSLQLCRKHDTTRRNYQLYAIPIIKTCPHKSTRVNTTEVTTSTTTPKIMPHSTLNIPFDIDYPIKSTNVTSNSYGSSLMSNSVIVETPPIPMPRTRKCDLLLHTYQNVPSPIFPTESKINSCNYKEHYQQHQQQNHQDMQQYSYPIPCSSSSQLTLPLTRSPYHSFTVSSLKTSLVHTNSTRHNHPHHKDNNMSEGNGYGYIGESLSLSLLHGGRIYLDSTNDHQSHNQSLRQPSNTQRRNDRKKYRKRERNDREIKHRRSSDARRRSEMLTNQQKIPPLPFSETSFGRIQELGIPESYKISYPHYYEDNNTADCQPINYKRAPKRNSDYYSATTLTQQSAITNDKSAYAENNSFIDKSPSEVMSPPSVNQYPEIYFRDIGQEIDV